MPDMVLLFIYLLIAHLVVTAAMTGVIWIIQLVHYPLLAGLREDSFAQWHSFHSRQITYIVAPLMLGELLLSASLAWISKDAVCLTSLALTIGIWLSTVFVSVPIHEALGKVSDFSSGKSVELLRRLVNTNWIRTGLYSVKILLLTYYVLSLASLIPVIGIR